MRRIKLIDGHRMKRVVLRRAVDHLVTLLLIESLRLRFINLGLHRLRLSHLLCHG